MTNFVFDKIGQPITAGDFIVYRHSSGRCAGLRIGKVLKVKAEGGPDWEHNKLTVWGVDDFGSPRLMDEEVIVNFPDRVVVIQRHQISERFLDVLDKVPAN